MSASKPIIIGPGDGESIEIAAVRHVFKATGGLLAVEEFELLPASMGARPHIHGGHDEYFYVLDGEITFHDGVTERTVARGAFVAAPRGTAHGFRNAGPIIARGLGLFTPAGYENYFRDAHAALAGGAELDDELLARLRSRYDTTTL